ncbi:MAG: MFS transporter [Anaerolineae bacterium]
MSFFNHREARGLSSPQAVAEYVQRHLPWSMRAGIVDAMFFQLAQQIMSAETVIPLLLTSLGATTVVLGTVTALVHLGTLLPQLLMAGLTEGLRYKKPISLISGAFERGSFFLIGLAVWAWGGSAPRTVLILFVVLRVLGSISLGMILPAWSTMIGKVIPTRRRGQFFGIGRSLGAVLGVGGALLAGQLLETQPYPRGFALCLMLGSAAMFVSWGGLAFTREPPDLEVKPRTPMVAYLKQLPGVLRRDRNYTWFVIARMVTVLGTMAMSFVIVYGAGRFALTGTQIGGLTATIAVVQAVMYLVWGTVADRLGHKAVLSACAVAMGGAVACAAWTPTVAGLYVALGLVGAAVGGEIISGSNIILEFARPGDRPTYIGLTSTLLAPVRALAPIIGGVLASTLGFEGLFVVAALLSLGGFGLLALRVTDPRSLVPQSVAGV